MKMRKNIYIKLIKWILGIIVSIITIALIVNGVLNPPISNHSTSDSEWLGFWGSFLGGIVGGIMTLVGVILSNNLLREQFAEDKKPIVIPLNITKDLSTKEIVFEICNVGLGVALDIQVSTRIFSTVDTGNEELNIMINDKFKYRKGIYGNKSNLMQFLICNPQDTENEIVLNSFTNYLIKSIVRGIKDYKCLAKRKDAQNIVIGYVDISYTGILESHGRKKERFNMLLDVKECVYSDSDKYSIKFIKL